MDGAAWEKIGPGNFSGSGVVIKVRHKNQEKTLLSGRLLKLDINHLVRSSDTKLRGGVDITCDVSIDDSGHVWVHELGGSRQRYE